MNDSSCNNGKASAGCPLALTIKVLLVVAAAEFAIHAYAIFSGAGNDADQLLKSLIRILIVGIVVFFFIGLKGSGAGTAESESSKESEEPVDDNEINPLPNIDALTRTSNERGLTISILELMALADRYGHKLSIGMIKAANLEQLEKSAADEAMVNMAGLMTESLRLPDRIGRFKDDVFMVLLPESDIDGAAIVADRLREKLQKGMGTDSKVDFSVWIGMTEFQRGEDMQSLLERTEAAVIQSETEENGICIKRG